MRNQKLSPKKKISNKIVKILKIVLVLVLVLFLLAVLYLVYLNIKHRSDLSAQKNAYNNAYKKCGEAPVVVVDKYSYGFEGKEHSYKAYTPQNPEYVSISRNPTTHIVSFFPYGSDLVGYYCTIDEATKAYPQIATTDSPANYTKENLIKKKELFIDYAKKVGMVFYKPSSLPSKDILVSKRNLHVVHQSGTTALTRYGYAIFYAYNNKDPNMYSLSYGCEIVTKPETIATDGDINAGIGNFNNTIYYNQNPYPMREDINRSWYTAVGLIKCSLNDFGGTLNKDDGMRILSTLEAENNDILMSADQVTGS